MQTNNRRIYACGDVLGGFNCVNIANYEAKIAINNALSLPKLKVNYLSIPWAVLTNPMVAQVGFIETLAKQQYCQKEFGHKGFPSPECLRVCFSGMVALRLESQIK